MEKDCQLCGCILFEQKHHCSCPCHHALNILLEMEHGNKEKILRDLESEPEYSRIDDFISNRRFNVPSARYRAKSIADAVRMIHDMNPGVEVKVGTALGDADAKTMSVEHLIDHSIYTGIAKGKLPNGFAFDKDTKAELMRVASGYDVDKRLTMITSFIMGYQRGFDNARRYGR